VSELYEVQRPKKSPRKYLEVAQTIELPTIPADNTKANAEISSPDTIKYTILQGMRSINAFGIFVQTFEAHQKYNTSSQAEIQNVIKNTPYCGNAF